MSSRTFFGLPTNDLLFIFCTQNFSTRELLQKIKLKQVGELYRNIELIKLVSRDISIGYDRFMIINENSDDEHNVLILYTEEKL